MSGISFCNVHLLYCAFADETGTLASRGTAQIEKLPEVLRLTMDMTSSGPTIGQAMARVKQR